MNAIRIVVSVDTLTGLKKIGSNYHLLVTPLKTDGTPLNNLNVPTQSEFTIEPVGLNFILIIGITDGNYSIPDARFRIKIDADPILYPNSQFFTLYRNFAINNTSGSSPITDFGEMTLYFSSL